MASTIQLKRSAQSGKVPDTGSLNLGELAINTYDGKIYFKKSGSVESVESVLTTNSVVTGSIRLEGTGSFGSLKVNDTLTINHGEAIISGSALVTSDLTILGAVNARQFNIGIISSSILYTSGSNKFGDTTDDTHQFTGSVSITGSFLLNGQEVGGGTTSGSFTGSFTGDGSGLRGVVSDDIPRDGWDYNANSSASISDFNSVSDKYYIDFEQSQSTAVGTPVGFKGFLTNVSGSTQILPTLDSIDFIVGDTLVASIGASGIQASIPTGTVSGSSQLTSSYDSRYVLSGSITQTTWDNIASKPNGIVSGSSQVIGILDSLNTFTASQSTASLVTSISNLNTFTSSQYISNSYFATTGSNSFIGNQNISGTIYLTGSIIPSGSFVYDLGSETNSFRDLFLSTGSIRFHNPDGTEQGRITVDARSGDISLLKTAGLTNEQKATIGQGNINPDFLSAVSASNLFVQNKIVLPIGGTVHGINLIAFSSSVSSTIINQNTATSSYETKGRGIISGSSQLNNASIENLTVINLTTVNETASVIFSSGSNRFGDFGNDTHSFTGSVQISGSFTLVGSSTATSYNGTINATNGIVSGSSQITYANISSIPGGIVSGSTQTIANLPTGVVSGSTQTIANLPTGTVSGSSQINVMSTTNIARLATTGSNTFSAQQTISSSAEGLYISSAGSAQTLRLSSTTNNNTLFRMNNFNNNFYDIQNQPSNNSLVIDYNDTTRLEITSGGTVQPGANGTQDLGSTSLRWSTIYTSDLSLNNGIGDWTIVEGEDDLFLYNNKKGKVYKFALTEVDPNVATPKKS